MLQKPTTSTFVKTLKKYGNGHLSYNFTQIHTQYIKHMCCNFVNIYFFKCLIHNKLKLLPNSIYFGPKCSVACELAGFRVVVQVSVII